MIMQNDGYFQSIILTKLGFNIDFEGSIYFNKTEWVSIFQTE
jgi:hypothetical protein